MRTKLSLEISNQMAAFWFSAATPSGLSFCSQERPPRPNGAKPLSDDYMAFYRLNEQRFTNILLSEVRFEDQDTHKPLLPRLGNVRSADCRTSFVWPFVENTKPCLSRRLRHRGPVRTHYCSNSEFIGVWINLPGPSIDVAWCDHIGCDRLRLGHTRVQKKKFRPPANHVYQKIHWLSLLWNFALSFVRPEWPGSMF